MAFLSIGVLRICDVSNRGLLVLYQVGFEDLIETNG